MLLHRACLLFILLLTALIISAEEKKVRPIMPLYPKSTHYIFEERVNVRATPNLKGKVLGVALIGESVEIIAGLNRSEELYGIRADWYKVRWKGELISLNPFGGKKPELFILKSFSGKGFRPEISLLQVSYGFGDGPVSGGTSTLYYWKNDHFAEISRHEYESVNDNRRYNRYIFPSDEGGKANTLRIEHRVIEYDELEWAREYIWDGEHFKPVE